MNTKETKTNNAKNFYENHKKTINAVAIAGVGICGCVAAYKLGVNKGIRNALIGFACCAYRDADGTIEMARSWIKLEELTKEQIEAVCDLGYDLIKAGIVK